MKIRLLLFISFLLILSFSVLYSAQPDAKKMVEERMEAAKETFLEVNKKLDSIDNYLLQSGQGRDNVDAEQLNAIKKDLRENILQSGQNVFMIIEFRPHIYFWIHAHEPYEWNPLNPIAPINEGIMHSLWTVPPEQMPIIFVFGNYKETVHLIPKVNTPV